MDMRTIVVLEGDQTGQELLEASLRVLQPDVVGFDLALPRFDLSLGTRRRTSNGIVHEAARAIADHGLGLKAATITPEGRDDIGSPNRILREDIGGKVIVRTGRRIPGVLPVGGVHAPISSRRIRFGEPMSSRPSGVIVAAFRPRPCSRIACAASFTTAFFVVRRFSSERS